VLGALSVLALGVCLSAKQEAPPQQPPTELPVSVERIKEELEKNPTTRFNTDVHVKRPVATFRSRVDQRVYVPTLHEWIDKEFRLTALQRQSAAWANNGGIVVYGIRLDPLFKSLNQALERRRLRKIREQIARELAQLEAARKRK
jgi:hypothetical protein